MSMKTNLISLILCINALTAFADGYPSLVKVKEYPQKDDLFIYRSDEEMDPYDDHTGNFIWFNQDGILMGYNVDEYRFLKFDGNFDFTEYMSIDRFYCLNCIKGYGNDFLISDAGDGNYLYSRDGKCIFNLFLSKITGEPIYQEETYYDEKSDILFVKYRNELYSVVHPSTDQEANAVNFRNTEQTLSLLKGETSIYKGDLGLDANNNLTVDGQEYAWEKMISANSQIYDMGDRIFVYKGRGNVIAEIYYASEDDGEIVEATAVHPSGDFYVLKYNQKTKLHTLYRIQNTWDASYRKEWYKAHPVKESSSKSENQTTSSDLSLPGKTLACTDNLRLRSEDSSSSSVVVSMLKGTKVKVLKIGHEETIDGIKNNWVQVEVLDGAKDKDGKAIKAGTKGWCFAGYLE